MAIVRALRDLSLVMAVWVVLGLFALVWRGQEGLLVAGGCAVLNLLFSRWLAARTWEGTVLRLEMRRVRQPVADRAASAEAHWVDRVVADVRLADGALVTIPAAPDWQVGDRIVGRRGEATPDNGPGLARA